MKDKNKKTKKKEVKQKEVSEFSGFTFAMGEMDLKFEINLKNEDLLNPNSSSEEDKYLSIDTMTSVKDLSFLKDKNEDFLNTIKISPNSEFTKQILLGNKISKKKCFIDFICYGRPKFEGEEEFFTKIFDYVTVNNKLQINKTPLQDGSRWSLIIELKHKDKTQIIKAGKTPQEEKEEKQKEEGEKKEEEEKMKQEKEENEKQEMEEKKQQKIKQYKEKREEEKKKKEEAQKKEEEKKEGENKGEENEENKNENNNENNTEEKKQDNENQNNEEQGNEEEEE